MEQPASGSALVLAVLFGLCCLALAPRSMSSKQLCSQSNLQTYCFSLYDWERSDVLCVCRVCASRRLPCRAPQRLTQRDAAAPNRKAD